MVTTLVISNQLVNTQCNVNISDLTEFTLKNPLRLSEIKSKEER